MSPVLPPHGSVTSLVLAVKVAWSQKYDQAPPDPGVCALSNCEYSTMLLEPAAEEVPVRFTVAPLPPAPLIVPEIEYVVGEEEPEIGAGNTSTILRL